MRDATISPQTGISAIFRGLAICEDGARVDGGLVRLTGGQVKILSMIVAGGGVRVEKQAFIDAGAASDRQSLKVQVCRIREKFRDAGLPEPVVRGARRFGGSRNEALFDAYALNALVYRPVTPEGG